MHSKVSNSKKPVGLMLVLEVFSILLSIINIVFGSFIIFLGYLAIDTIVIVTMDPMHYLKTGPTIAVVLGMFCVIIGILGIIGSIRGDCCVLQVNIVIILILFVLEISMTSVLYLHRNRTEDELSILIKRDVRFYNGDMKIDLDVIILDEIQESFSCCGSEGVSDFKNEIPGSCCSVKLGQNAINCSIQMANTAGCVNTVKTKIDQNFTLLIWISFSTSCVQFLSVIVYSCIVNTIKRYRSNPDLPTNKLIS